MASELKADGTRGVHVLAADSHIDGGKVVGDPFIRMDGRLVFKAAVEKMTESARNVLTKANLATNDVDLYIPHQANLRIMNMVREKLGIDEEPPDDFRQSARKPHLLPAFRLLWIKHTDPED